jgi:hypothetical protein
MHECCFRPPDEDKEAYIKHLDSPTLRAQMTDRFNACFSFEKHSDTQWQV